MELSYHAEGQTNTILQHVACTWVTSSHNTLLCFFMPSNITHAVSVSLFALLFVFVPGPFEGVFQNRRYWHWSPNQTQAPLHNWNQKGRMRRERRKWGLGFSIKGHEKEFPHKLVKCIQSLSLFSIVELWEFCFWRLSPPSRLTFVKTCKKGNDRITEKNLMFPYFVGVSYAVNCFRLFFLSR